MVGLSRAGCTENQFGKDGCEPEPFLCRQSLLKSVASCVFFLLAFHFQNESFLSRIVCEKGADCELEEVDVQTTTCKDGNITVPQDFESFDGKTCEDDCAKSDEEQDDTKRCRFWRFVSFNMFLFGTDFASEGPSWNNEVMFVDDGFPMHSVRSMLRALPVRRQGMS